MTAKKHVVLPCAGTGSRLDSEVPKQYLKINNKTILEHTVKVFLEVDQIDKIWIITAPDDKYIENLLPSLLQGLSRRIEVLRLGGATRAHTVKNAVNVIDCTKDDWILVHDVARCCLTIKALNRLISALNDEPIGGILAMPATDTIKYSKDGSTTDTTLERTKIFLAQTPQMFRSGILKDALNEVDLNLITDEASAIEKINYAIRLIEGEVGNIKVTYPLDMKLAEVILNQNP